jgi:hypothetical protein
MDNSKLVALGFYFSLSLSLSLSFSLSLSLSISFSLSLISSHYDVLLCCIRMQPKDNHWAQGWIVAPGPISLKDVQDSYCMSRGSRDPCRPARLTSSL